MQFAGAGHLSPHHLFPVLVKHGGFGILEDDVIPRVAAVEFLLNLQVQIVVGVFGFPVTPGHAEGILDRAVGEHAGAGFEFRNQ